MRFPGLRKFPLPPYAGVAGRDPAGLWLDANENRWGPAPSVVAALRRFRPGRIAAYPDAGALTKAAAERYGVDSDRLVLTNGADEAICALISLLTGPGGRIVMPVPGFRFYFSAAGIRGARIRGVDLGARFEFPLSAMKKAVSRSTRLVVLTAPNNPTGTDIPAGQAEEVVRTAARFGIPVLVDETYAGFDGRSFSRMTRRNSNLIVVGSFSKFFALAGLRLGYAIAGPEVCATLRAVIPPYSVNAAAVEAGLAALADGPYYERVRREIAGARRDLASALRRSGLTVFPSAANFLCVRVGPEAERLRERLASRKIYVKSFPGDARLSECLRLTVGRPEENERLVEALEEARSPEALLFDMDGVLVDVSASYRRAVERTVFRFSSRRPSPAEIDRCKLRPDMNDDWSATAALLESAGVSVPRRKIVAAFQELYLGADGRSGLHRAERWRLPISLLGRLACKYRLGIVTGRSRDEAGRALRRFGAESCFQAVVAREDVGSRPKPHPRGLRLALERLGVRRAIYFGDSTADMAAARAAGLPAVGVRPPGMGGRCGWPRKMKDAGAARLVEDLAAELECFL